jgi:hypothetical protein
MLTFLCVSPGGAVQADDTLGGEEEASLGPAPQLHRGPDGEIQLLAPGRAPGWLRQWLRRHLPFTLQLRR